VNFQLYHITGIFVKRNVKRVAPASVHFSAHLVLCVEVPVKRMWTFLSSSDKVPHHVDTLNEEFVENAGDFQRFKHKQVNQDHG
jgi:hypothetical protein